MRILLFAILLSACATTNQVDDLHQPPEETVAGSVETPKTTPKPVKKAPKPVADAPPIKPPPPTCEVTTEDKRAAFLESLDCLLKTGEPKPKP